MTSIGDVDGREEDVDCTRFCSALATGVHDSTRKTDEQI